MKQKFLRTEIIEGGFQPEPFMMYMGSIKNEGTIHNNNQGKELILITGALKNSGKQLRNISNA